ncbi:MAG: hypothetical protein IIB00_07700 [candidate division Zixibacteria bacterium]|nr:hypothetical protein [candidate division Zixibacteria bacterium]
MKIKSAFFVLVLLLSICVNPAEAAEFVNHYIALDKSQSYSRQEMASMVAGLGGQLRHTLSPYEFIIYLPKKEGYSLTRKLQGAYIENRRTEIYTDSGIFLGANMGGRRTGDHSQIWDIIRGAKGSGSGVGKVALPGTSSDSLFCGFGSDLSEGVGKEQAGSPLRVSQFTRFMVGEIAVAIGLVESNGAEYNWISEQEDTAFARAIIEFDNHTQYAFDLGIDVRWVYEFHSNIPTTFEPITTDYPDGDDLGWIGDVMNYFGMANSWDGTFDLSYTLRTTYKTNWAMSVFVVMNQPGFTKFPSGHRAFVPIRNNKDVATFVEISYTGLVLNDLTLRHETSHIFGAIDEIDGGDFCNAFIDCLVPFGYLSYVNGNCVSCPGGVLCFMNELNTTDYCSFSLGHVGWVDSDGDGAPDPIDPNSGVWMSIFPVSPGDTVNIKSLALLPVTSLAITENNFDDKFGNGLIIWDGKNASYNTEAPGFYYYVVNENPTQVGELHLSNPASTPLISNGAFWFDDKLKFKLTNSFAYVSIELFDAAGALFGRPLWDKFMKSSPTQVREIDLSFLPDGQYRADIKTWTSHGSNGITQSVNFIQYICGDADGGGDVNVGDALFIINYIFGGPTIPDPVERADCDGDGIITTSDATYLVNYIFTIGWPAPICSGSQS